MDYSGGSTFTATWGKAGTAGRKTDYPVTDWDSYYRKKVVKGYTDVTGGGQAVPMVRTVPPSRAAAPASPAVVSPAPASPASVSLPPANPAISVPANPAPAPVKDPVPIRRVSPSKRAVTAPDSQPQPLRRFYKPEEEKAVQFDLFNSLRPKISERFLIR
jgi:hypothetical protein